MSTSIEIFSKLVIGLLLFTLVILFLNPASFPLLLTPTTTKETVNHDSLYYLWNPVLTADVDLRFITTIQMMILITVMIGIKIHFTSKGGNDE